MRDEVARATAEVRQALGSASLPPPVPHARCRLCSLRESCIPQAVGEAQRLQALMDRLYTAE